jgi:hypothetical protein
MASNSRPVAALVGPITVVVAATEAVNPNTFRESTPEFVYLNGAILFASGLALVRAHPSWERNWSTIITLLGWATLALGTYRMSFPETVTNPPNSVLLGILLVLGSAGAYLSYQGYRSGTAPNE